MDLVCKKCDVYVGFGGAGVIKKPENKTVEWLATHCWCCGRSVSEVERDPHGREMNMSFRADTQYTEISYGHAVNEDLTIDPETERRLDSDGIWRMYHQPTQQYWVDEDQRAHVNTPIDRYLASYTGGEPRGGLTKDVAFNRFSFGEGQPENPDQGQIYVGTDGLRVELVQDFRDEDLQRVCTWAINATRGIDPDNPPEPVDWEEMLQGGLQTALEDFRIAFGCFSASRTSTHQIVRTRAAAFHQQSQRAHYYGDRPSVRMPESFVGKVGRALDDPYGTVIDSSQGGPVEFNVDDEYKMLAAHAAWFYRLACSADISYQDARFGLLEGTANFILWEGSLREFINVYAYRACSMFQWEISYLFREMRRVLVESHPYLDKYIKISCEKTHGALDANGPMTALREAQELQHGRQAANAHSCTFQGWESVEDQCDFPYARESNRTFKSERHAIKKATA